MAGLVNTWLLQTPEDSLYALIKRVWLFLWDPRVLGVVVIDHLQLHQCFLHAEGNSPADWSWMSAQFISKWPREKQKEPGNAEQCSGGCRGPVVSPWLLWISWRLNWVGVWQDWVSLYVYSDPVVMYLLEDKIFFKHKRQGERGEDRQALYIASVTFNYMRQGFSNLPRNTKNIQLSASHYIFSKSQHPHISLAK